MRRSLYNPSDYKSILFRIKHLESNSEHRWGRFNVFGLITLLKEEIDIATGDRLVKENYSWWHRNVTKYLVLQEITGLSYLPTPPEVEREIRYPEINDIESAKQVLIIKLKKFFRMQELDPYFPHETMGDLNRRQWGKFLWKYFDHHLREFGV